VARAYGVSLSCIALIVSIARGILFQNEPAVTLINAMSFMLAFAVIGFAIGFVTEFLVRQAIEVNFRQALNKSQLTEIR
jgi:hypothetical protein